MATDLDKIKNQVAREQKETYGDESATSGAPDPDENDTDQIFSEVIGHEPEEDASLEKEVSKAEEEAEEPLKE